MPPVAAPSRVVPPAAPWPTGKQAAAAIEARTGLSLYPAQRKFLQGALAPRTRIAAWSLGRGGGKTALCAALAAEAIAPDGCLWHPGAQIVVVAAGLTQARILFSDVVGYLDRSGLVDRLTVGANRRSDREWQHRDYTGEASLTHRASGTHLRCISSDHRRAHGLRPWLVIADEGAQWYGVGGGRAMWSALLTAQGKVPGSRILAIGTAPEAGRDHWFGQLLSDDSGDPGVWRSWHAAAPDARPEDRRGWHAANPGLRYGLPEKSTLEFEAKRAAANPADLQTFRALRLNAGLSDVQDSDLLLSADLWAGCLSETAPDPAHDPGPYVLGVDLGATLSLSAVAAYWPQTGRLAAVAACGDTPDLAERGRQDGAGSLYQRAAASGELLVRPGRVPDVQGLLAEAWARWGRPALIVADRYRQGDLLDALDALGDQTVPASFPKGPQADTQAVRRFSAAAAEGRLVVSRSAVLLTYSVAAARTKPNYSGERRLWKSGRTAVGARDDLAAAALLAVSAGDDLAAVSQPVEFVTISRG